MTPEFFISNRRRLLQSLGDELIVIAANGLMQRNADVTYRFRQDSNFLYLTGLADLADAILVITSGESFLIIRDKTAVEITFEGNYNCDEIAKKSGIHRVYSSAEGWAQLKRLQLNRNKLFTITAPPSRAANFYTNPARRRLTARLARLQKSSAELVDIRPQLIKLRQIKQPAEVAAIKHAIKITQRGFEAAKKLMIGPTSEQALQAVFDQTFTEARTQHGYQPIIASGKRANTLHYTANDHAVTASELVLMDVGAEVNGYSADISRTYSAHFSARQRKVFEAVGAVQQTIIKRIEPGLSWHDLNEMSEQIMGEWLIKLKLISKNQPAEVRRYFTHGISNSLGLDEHDPSDYTKPLAENMVITVEPGIYIPKEDIGVRIEDDILITKTGAENLSKHIPYQ